MNQIAISYISKFIAIGIFLTAYGFGLFNIFFHVRASNGPSKIFDDRIQKMEKLQIFDKDLKAYTEINRDILQSMNSRVLALFDNQKQDENEIQEQEGNQSKADIVFTIALIPFILEIILIDIKNIQLNNFIVMLISLISSILIYFARIQSFANLSALCFSVIAVIFIFSLIMLLWKSFTEHEPIGR